MMLAVRLRRRPRIQPHPFLSFYRRCSYRRCMHVLCDSRNFSQRPRGPILHKLMLPALVNLWQSAQ